MTFRPTPLEVNISELKIGKIMTKDALNGLLSDALQAHGGLDHWSTFKGQSSKILSGGGLWAFKGLPLASTYRDVTSEFSRQIVTMTQMGHPDWTLFWSPEKLVIRDSRGNTIAEREDPRAAFAGHDYRTTWDPLHLSYFSGYAMWNYHALPFILAAPGYEVEEIDPVVQDGQSLRGIRARFPESVHTHTREQRFYFGSDNLLRRYDYDVDVWRGSPAVHLLSEYVDVQGIRLPRKRTVFVRNPDGTPNLSFNTVTIDISDYRLF